MKHRMKVDKEIRSAQLDKYLDLYLEYKGDHKKAWVDAGYSEKTLQHSMAKVRENWVEVEKRIRIRIGSHVPMALTGIIELAENAKQESIRLKALQDIMSRAGYDKAQELVVTEKKAEEMDDTELKDELKALLKRSNIAQQEELH